MTMRSTVLAVCAATLIAGCGGSSPRTAADGCRGLPTAGHPESIVAAVFGLDRLTLREICAQIGAPQAITRRRGAVTWRYADNSTLQFQKDRVVGITEIDGSDELSIGLRAR
jgi:hypothetical protein